MTIFKTCRLIKIFNVAIFQYSRPWRNGKVVKAVTKIWYICKKKLKAEWLGFKKGTVRPNPKRRNYLREKRRREAKTHHLIKEFPPLRSSRNGLTRRGKLNSELAENLIYFLNGRSVGMRPNAVAPTCFTERAFRDIRGSYPDLSKNSICAVT